jgi:spore germination protein YaaH
MKNNLKNAIILSFLLIAALSAPVNASPMIKHGFWEYPLPPTYTPDWNVLTHVGYMSWGLDGEGTLQSDGSIVFPPYLEDWNAIKNTTHAHGAKITVPVTARNFDTVDSVLANHQDEMAANIVSVVKTYGADGVIFDFEWITETNSITGTPNKELLGAMMAKVNTSLKAENPEYLVTTCVDSGLTTSAWQNPDINSNVDFAIMCCYDYSYPWDNTKTGPNAPFNDSTRFDVKDSVETMLNCYDASKLVLNVPFYGYDYITRSKLPGASFSSYSGIEMKTATQKAITYGKKWDNKSNTPYIVYPARTRYHQVWYDDNESLKIKFDYAKSKNLGGIGFWALGMEDSKVWSAFYD